MNFVQQVGNQQRISLCTYTLYVIAHQNISIYIGEYFW